MSCVVIAIGKTIGTETVWRGGKVTVDFCKSEESWSVSRFCESEDTIVPVDFCKSEESKRWTYNFGFSVISLLYRYKSTCFNGPCFTGTEVLSSHIQLTVTTANSHVHFFLGTRGLLFSVKVETTPKLVNELVLSVVSFKDVSSHL